MTEDVCRFFVLDPLLRDPLHRRENSFIAASPPFSLSFRARKLSDFFTDTIPQKRNVLFYIT